MAFPVQTHKGRSRKQAMRHQSSLQMAPTFDKNWLTLNVGGAFFATFRLTITKATPPNSPLHRVAANSTNVEWDRDETGAYIIDRDPAYFQTLLNYLRTGHAILGPDMSEEAVLIEAEYFNLPNLIKILRQRIEERNQRWSRAAVFNQQFQHQLQQQQQQQQQLFMTQQQAVGSQSAVVGAQRQHPLAFRIGQGVGNVDVRDKWPK